MFSELFNGTVVYSKRFPLPDNINDLIDAAPPMGDDKGKTEDRDSFVNYMRQADEKSIYVVRPDRIEFCQHFLDYAKEFSEEFEVGIDIVNNQFSYLVKLYINFAHFCGRYKEMMVNLMIAADEFSVDSVRKEDCEMTASLRCYTHDLYYDGQKRNLY